MTAMKKITNRLNNLICRAASDCGFEENIQKTMDMEFRLLDLIEQTIRASYARGFSDGVKESHEQATQETQEAKEHVGSDCPER